MKQKYEYSDWLISFDNDGVMSNTLPLVDKVGTIVAAKMSVPYYPGLAAKLYYSDRKPRVWGERHDEIAKEFLDTLWATWRTDEWVEKVELFPGVPEMLRRLSDMGFYIGVATSSSAKRVAAPLGKAGVMPLVKSIASVNDLELPDKPAPDCLATLAQGARIPAERTIHIGDTPPDIRMAKNFGAKSIGASYGGYSPSDVVRAEKPDAMMLDAREIRYIPEMIEAMIKSENIR
ncbi:MAG: HAD-IA family hydrolase [Rickettsiales bacterium]|jgi:HAD superfamily hydrolase (TIGR01509 family)|nr:HAD-IA family hydrolase [Rickettsiales bacterium]